MAQIGTIKVQTETNGAVSVPVFDTGDSSSDVYEFLRVQTDGGIGFIPLVDTAEATFSYLRVQSQNNGVVAVHDVASLGLATQTNYLEDDWDDNSLTSRTSPEDAIFAHPDGNEAGDVLIGRYRPEWNIQNGSPSVVSGEVEFPSGGQTIVTSSQLSSGSITYDFRFTSTGDAENFYNSVFSTGDLTAREGDRELDFSYYQFIDGGTDRLTLERSDSGTNNTTVFTTGGWGFDTNTHTLGTSRDSYGNFEMFLDGASVGTGSDTTYSDFEILHISTANKTDTNTTHYIDNLVVN